MIGLIDVTDIHDAQAAPDALGICIHCGLAGVEEIEYFDHGACEVVAYERCVFCKKAQP